MTIRKIEKNVTAGIQEHTSENQDARYKIHSSMVYVTGSSAAYIVLRMLS